MPHQVIRIHVGAPTKPAFGQTCNGCGVCCLAEPCPLGVLLSWRRQGACVALLWSAPQGRYLCGAVEDPRRWLAWLPAGLRSALKRLVLRWIAASAGCDCDIELVP